MEPARRPSTPPALPPLRAKTIGKLRNPERMEARESGVHAIWSATRDVSDGALGAHLGGQQFGAQVRSGHLVLTPHEIAALLPPRVAIRWLCAALRVSLKLALESEPQRLADAMGLLDRIVAFSHS